MTESNVSQVLPIVKLEDVEDTIQISDMNYLFNYKRLKTPDNEASSFFALFYKEATQEQWITKNGLLSKYFSIAKTEDVIERIRQALNAEMSGERHFRWNAMVRSSFILSGFDLELPEDNAADMIIFKLITNVDAAVNGLISRAKLSFNVTNSFAGDHALFLNYGFLKTMGNLNEAGEQTGRTLQSNNFFLLEDYTTRLIHDRALTVSFEQVSSVQNAVASKIELFKTIPITLEFLADFQLKMPIKFSKKFIAIYDELPDEYRNFYYCSFIWSIILDADRKLNVEARARKYIAEYVSEYTAPSTES